VFLLIHIHSASDRMEVRTTPVVISASAMRRVSVPHKWGGSHICAATASRCRLKKPGRRLALSGKRVGLPC
jgi:hypothetical protein